MLAAERERPTASAASIHDVAFEVQLEIDHHETRDPALACGNEAATGGLVRRIDEIGVTRRYIGKVDITGQRGRLVQGGSTRMFCFPQEVMDTEARLIEALDKTRAARQEQGLLLLLDEAGQVVWRFKPRS